MKRTENATIFLIMLSLLACLHGCGQKSHSNPNNKKEEKLVVPVEIAQVTAGEIAAFFTGTATIEAEEETEVVAKVGGVVEKIMAEEGQYVKAGDVLAKLDDEKISVQLKQAQANLKKLENNFQRNMDLHEKKLISAEVFQQAQYEYEHQKAVYEMAELDLTYTSIRSPISGVVAERLVKIGNMVLPNQAVFRVTGLDPLISVLHVPERHLGKLEVGQKATLTVDALEQNGFTGRIKRVSPVVDPATGTVKVTVEMHDPSGMLKPGMFARINIIYDVHRDILLLPKDAIVAEDRESAVFVVHDSIAVRQPVRIGYTNTTHVEVTDGLALGDTVVTIGKGSLKDSTQVDIVTGKKP